MVISLLLDSITIYTKLLRSHNDLATIIGALEFQLLMLFPN